MTTDFYTDLEQRGLIFQANSPDLREILAKGPLTAYIGFDPTASSLHVGSLLPVLALMRLERAGHRPIALVGGATGMIGDPSGKSAERSMISRATIDENVAGIRRQLEHFLDFSGPRGAVLVNNLDWLGEVRLLDFLRDIGKAFSVNQMVVRDSVRMRLEDREQGISYTEFSYALLQAYDYLELYDRHGCTLQVGGSDQWGNILDGCDLIRRLRGGTAFGLTMPLVTRADGKKFGKSEQGNVWLDPARTSPFAFHQFWLNADDVEAVKYLKFFTFLPVAEIATLAAAAQAEPEKRLAQKRLADEVTGLVHGAKAVVRCHRAAAILFEGADLEGLDAADLKEVFADAPRVKLARAALGTPAASLVEVAMSAGLFQSKSQARQAIATGSIAINQKPAGDAGRQLDRTDLLHDSLVVLRRGKKTYYVVEVG